MYNKIELVEHFRLRVAQQCGSNVLPFFSSFFSQFGMVCDKSWYVSASQSAFMAGLMLGNMIFAKVADK